MLKRIVVLLFFVQLSSGQDNIINRETVIEICTNLRTDKNLILTNQSNSLVPNESEDEAIERILSVVGGQQTFVLVPCNEIKSAAVAFQSQGIRFIVYEKSFMETQNIVDEWNKLFVLAHEIGHHLLGHTVESFQSYEERRQDEIEADEFAAFVLGKLGANLEEASDFINTAGIPITIQPESTHPQKSKRLLAIEYGWSKAFEGSDYLKKFKNRTTNALEYFYKAYAKYNLKDYNGAVLDLDKAIELDKKEKYFQLRGSSKLELEDYSDAIKDFNYLINLNPDNARAYFNRAFVKFYLEDYSEAISDYTKSIELATDSETKFGAFLNRGVAMLNIQDFDKALSDINKAINIKPNISESYFQRANVLYDLKEYDQALVDYSKSISINPKYSDAYFNRGLLKFDLEDYSGAISDFNKTLDFDNQNSGAYRTRGLSKVYLNNYEEAIIDFSKAIEINPADTSALLNRAQLRYNLNDYRGAILDLDNAINENPNDERFYILRGLSKDDVSDFNGAISDYSKAIGINPNKVDPYYYRGISKFNNLGDLKGACQDFRKAQQLGLKDVESIIKTYCN